MRKLLLIALILSAGIASAATFTATGNASLSSPTNWSPSQPTCAGGETIVTGAFTVTDDVAGCKLGDAVGIGVSVSAAGGKFVVNTGLTLTLKGTGITTAVPWKTVANSTFDASAANVTVLYDCAAYCAGVNLGNYKDASTTVSDIPAANITWSTTSAANTISGIAAFAWDKTNNIYIIKMRDGTNPDPGPVANTGGTGLGAFGNTSFSKSAGGFDGTTANEVSSYAGIALNGDFYIDYPKGMIYYKSSAATLTITFTFKYGTWAGPWGIISNGNTANNSLTINGTYSHCGSQSSTVENSGMCIGAFDHYAPNLTDTTRTLTLGSPTFNYCTRAIALYAQHVTPTDATHHNVLSGATFNNCRYPATGPSANQADGLIQMGYNESYLDFTNPVLNSFTQLFTTFTRQTGTIHDVIVTGATGNGSNLGHIITFQMVPSATINDTFQNATALNGFQQPVTGGSNPDGATFQYGGSAGNVNHYLNNQICHAYRAGRLAQYMDVENNIFCGTNHHGFTFQSASGYIDGTTITFKNNITYGLLDTGNLQGGITTGYNASHWIDSFTADNGTYDGGLRFIKFNDEETSVTLVTRFKARNNIGSNNGQGIYRPPSGASSNITSLGITQLDYNDDYNNSSSNVTNVLQGTFMFGGVNYNSSGSKTALGAYIFNPSYTLPDATNRSLVMTVAGTSGTTKSILVAWNGGTAVQYVAFQGTAAAGSTGTTLVTTNTFPTTGTALKTYQVMIVGGTGSGQNAMVISNTATTLTIISNTSTSQWAVTPDATSVYLVITPDQKLFDSGAVQSIYAQLYTPELTTTNGTYTDANITIAMNYPGTSGANNGVNPNYTSATDFHPHNAALKGTGLGALDIGALPVSAGGCGMTILLGGAGCP